MLQPKDTDWLNGYKNKTHLHSVYMKPTSDQRHIWTECERKEKCIPYKWKVREMWNSYSHIRQNRPEKKDYNS